jgi:hypothetical protein
MADRTVEVSLTDTDIALAMARTAFLQGFMMGQTAKEDAGST